MFAILLTWSPIVSYLQDRKSNESGNGMAEAASLTEVQLLTDVNINAALSDSENPNYYNLNFGLTGTGVTDVELVNADRTVVFYVPELAGQLVHNGGTANVQVDILPITLAEDLPVLYDSLDPVTTTLNDLVGTLATAIQNILNNPITGPLLNVQGLDELTDSLDALNNLDTALQDLTSYTDNVQYIVNEDGTVVVSFTDGLGNHLETAVQDVVVDALNRVGTAIGNLEVGGVGGAILRPVVNPTIASLEQLVTTTINPLVSNILNGTVDLTSDLAGAQMIGQTSVNLDVLINNPAGVNGEVVVQGAGIQDSVIDAALLSSLQSSDTIVFDEDVTDPVLTSVEIEGDSTNGYVVSGTGEEPGDTVNVTNTDGVNVGTGTIDAGGNYSVELTGDVTLGELLTVQAVDEAGNRSEPFEVTVPEDPDITPPQLKDVAIEGNSTENYEVTGSTEADAIVVVRDNLGNELARGTADTNGNFNIPISAEDIDPDGEISVVAMDEAGNESDPANITVPADPDTTPPELNDLTIEGTSKENYIVSGTTETDAIVTIRDVEGNEIGTVISDAEGTFSIEVSSDNVDPADELSVTATDEAGNESDPTPIIVPDDQLAIESVPDIVFETTEIKNQETIVGRQDNNYVIDIIDTRKNGNWTLSAHAIDSLQNDDGDILPNSVFYMAGNEEISLEGSAAEVATKDDAVSVGTMDSITWAENEGILLKTNPIDAVSDSEYSTTIEWTLTDGP